MAQRRAAFSGNTSLIATFSSYIETGGCKGENFMDWKIFPN